MDKYYTLEKHLKDICEENPEYSNLNSTWNLNKKSCTEMLKNTIISFPHYSMHDCSHAETVISNIERLLGNRIEELSPTDTWMLLHAAYTHDLGMILTWKEIEKNWNSAEFKEYLYKTKYSTDQELKKAAEYLEFLSTGKKGCNDMDINPLTVSRYVMLINADYFRKQHALKSKEYIDSINKNLKLDLGHNNLVPIRLIKLLGKIAESHTFNTYQILDLEYETDGFNVDYTHPRFISAMLRIGDLLDIDNGRFNETSEAVIGKLPPSSLPHKEKHASTIHILITPEKIEYKADCVSTEGYLETRNFLDWTNNEINFLTVFWTEIIPKNIGGYAPKFSGTLYYNGKRDIENIASLKFNISQKKAFDIIEGSGIYKDKFVFLREIIQNAIDASKIQLWNDLKSDIYHSWVDIKDITDIQPYDLDSKIYASYPIDINFKLLDDGYIEVNIKDRGTGISIESLKRLCNVGEGISNDKYNKFENMPGWLRPTAGFGIGLQSIFMISDQFEIVTCTGDEALKIRAYSVKESGYLQIQKLEDKVNRGTTIRIRYKTPKSFSYSIFGMTMNYICSVMDPIDSKDKLSVVKSVEVIDSYINDTMFPISIKCDNVEIGDLTYTENMFICNIDPKECKEIKTNYIYCIKDKKILIWDKKRYVYSEIQPLGIIPSSVELRFKGVRLTKNIPRINGLGINLMLDLYGMDTKETIMLSRDELTSSGYNESSRIIDELIDIYKKIILCALNNSYNLYNELPTFDIYAFWGICENREREKISKAEFKKSNAYIREIIQNEDKKPVFKDIPVSEMIENIYDKYFINIDNICKHGRESKNVNEMIINNLKSMEEELSGIKEIIADEILYSFMDQVCWDDIRGAKSNSEFFVFKFVENRNVLNDLNENARKQILLGLGNEISEIEYTNLFSLSDKPAKRYAIPAIKEYEALAVKTVPYGTATPRVGNCYWILSPFTSDDVKNITGLSEDEFVNRVTSSDKFEKTVDYVAEMVNKSGRKKSGTVRTWYISLIREYYRIKMEAI